MTKMKTYYDWMTKMIKVYNGIANFFLVPKMKTFKIWVTKYEFTFIFLILTKFKCHVLHCDWLKSVTMHILIGIMWQLIF